MIRSRRRTGPPPPTGLRLITIERDVIPVEPVYTGWNGVAHQWTVTTDRTDILGMKIIGRLPARTWVNLNCRRQSA